jgi:hypothetical protein
VQRGLINPGKRQISVPGLGSTLTHYDSQWSHPVGKRSLAPAWHVIANADGTFDILRKGELLHGSIPDHWLESQLGRYGFCGEEYREIRRQLAEKGGR